MNKDFVPQADAGGRPQPQGRTREELEADLQHVLDTCVPTAELNELRERVVAWIERWCELLPWGATGELHAICDVPPAAAQGDVVARPPQFTSGSTHPEFEGWWDKFGQPLANDTCMSLRNIAFAAWAVAWDKGRRHDR